MVEAEQIIQPIVNVDDCEARQALRERIARALSERELAHLKLGMYLERGRLEGVLWNWRENNLSHGSMMYASLGTIIAALRTPDGSTEGKG